MASKSGSGGAGRRGGGTRSTAIERYLSGQNIQSSEAGRLSAYVRGDQVDLRTDSGDLVATVPGTARPNAIRRAISEYDRRIIRRRVEERTLAMLRGEI